MPKEQTIEPKEEQTSASTSGSKPRDFNEKIGSLKRRFNANAREIQLINDQGRQALTNPEEITQFKGMFRALDKYYNKFEECWEDLVDIHEAANRKDFPTEKERGLKQTIRKYYYEANTTFETLNSEPKSLPGPSTSGANSTHYSDLKASHSLPRMNLIKFDGQIRDWPKFRDTYTSLIHDDNSIPLMQKYHYLTTSLSGSAASIISHLALTDDNYELAWNALKIVFDNKRMLAATYLNNILAFKSVSNTKPTLESLNKFTSEIGDSVSAFKLLHITDETEFILFHLAIRSLDSITREHFELAHKSTQFPTFTNLITFVRERTLAMQLAECTDSKEIPAIATKRKDLQTPSFYRPRTLMSSVTNPNPNTDKGRSTSNLCIICTSGAHTILTCKKFLAATVPQRLQLLKGFQGCRACLNYNHKINDCYSRRTCRYCGSKTHNSTIHLDSQHNTGDRRHTRSPVRPAPIKDIALSANVLNSISYRGTKIILGTVVAHIRDCYGQFHSIRLVLDSGSENSFITYRAAKRLGLNITTCRKRISGIGQTVFDGATGYTSCVLKPRAKETPILKTDALVIPTISSNLPSTSLTSSVRNYYNNYELADPQFFEPAPVDFLLGADLYPEVITGPCVTLQETLPKLMSSIFGYVVLGKINSDNQEPTTSSFFTTTWGENLNENLKQFWEIEETPSTPVMNPDDKKCEDHFQQTFSRTIDGTYVVSLPFKENIPDFTSSSTIAMKRFHTLESKLNKSANLKANYTDFMEEYEDLKHMTRADGDIKFYIPHHCVVNKSKFKVVFDGSVKTNEGSLNDFLMVGGKLQNDSRLILMNFRLHAVAFTCDIVKMFRNILVNPRDRSFQGIFWRSDSSQAIQPYLLNTVTYGLVCSPFLALRVMKQLAIDEGKNFPQAASVLEKDIYVDDIATGSDNIEEALHLQAQIIDLLGKGTFSLSKWASNCPQILATVDEKWEKVEPVRVISEEDLQKILGLNWDPYNDNFIFRVEKIEQVFTKRGILSTVAKLYDPLGFLAPTVFLMKHFIQLLWKEGLDWDDCLPSHLRDDWDAIIQDLPQLSQIKLPRYIGHPKPFTYQIVGFADASAKGYCAALYIRIITSDTPIKVSLLISKTKLAPVKILTIPRLELCGALLLAKLYKSILTFLVRLPKPELEPCFFVDSSIVLAWIRTPSYKLKTFVANRVSQICTSVPPHWWRHVDSQDNASDCGSRGLLPLDLISHRTWWHGPAWLSLPLEEWPSSKLDRITLSDLPEVKEESVTTLVCTDLKPYYIIDWMTTMSSYQRIIRVVAWIQRFAYNSKRQGTAKGPLRMSEITKAFQTCVKIVQERHFFMKHTPAWKINNKHLAPLSPFQDQSGILRVGGRLRHSKLSQNQKHPILLPNNCHFTTVLVDYYHRIFLPPEPSLLDLRDNLLTRWQHVKKMSQHFWKRWKQEYLSSLQPKPKWMKANPNLEIGDLVCLKEPNAPVLTWPMGRVIATHPGKDGIVRVVTVQTIDSTYKRPVVKLVPLLPLKEPAYPEI